MDFPIRKVQGRNMTRLRSWFGGVMLLGVAVGPSQAGFVLVVNRADLGGNDQITWGSLGADGTAVTNPFNISSSGGVAATVSQPSTGLFARRDQGASWNGNFAPSSRLLWSDGSNGPGAIDFSNAVRVTGAGMQIQRERFGAFIATIQALSAAGDVLATFDVKGVSNAGNNPALFIGIEATGSDSFDKLRFNVDGDDFAINEVDVIVQPLMTAPAPAALPLALVGVAALGGVGCMRRRSTAG
ncbi:MAG: hypothetical protein ABGY75_03880 [Gemmataceae bacterium]